VGAAAAVTTEGQDPASAEFEGRLAERRQRIEQALAQWLFPPDQELVPQLKAACEHAVFSGGKRLRPLVCVLVAEASGGTIEDALAAAAAIELVHCYSLVHDDLPAMDDDDFRRGRPTCHKVHGEAMAILAGDALLTRAFEVAARGSPMSVAAGVCAILGHGAGLSGMVNGQAGDLLGEGQSPTEERVRWIHERKTAALFGAAARIGALCASSRRPEARALLDPASGYGHALGLAFQVVDDLLGRSGDSARTGKPVGKDDERKKLTYPAAIGEDGARAHAAALSEQARTEAAKFPRPGDLERLASRLRERVA
jgi:geranylgeranyl diphosphate synthase type II